jgi:mannan endo-1,4-beta-mannosidase
VRKIAIFLVVVAGGALFGEARADFAPDDFVHTDGTRFVAGGKPFAFVGANFAAIQGGRNREGYRATIAALQHDGLTVGRVWAFGEGPPAADAWFRKDQLFRAGPDGFIEESYEQLDRVLAAARSDGIRLIVTLSNNWSDYGGLPMYLRWVGLPEGEVEAFYRDERVRALYRAGVEKLLRRTNHVTGVRYVDDPTIFAWELMNESSVATPKQADARRDWIVEMARFIKARDPHHMVSSGVAGYTSRNERSEWIRVHQLKEIDYCDSHLYPQTSDRVAGWARLGDFLDDRAQLAHHVIGKPLVIGEFGFHTTGKDGDRWLGLPRKELFKKVLARLGSDGVAGALVWIYQPWPDFARDFGIYTDRGNTLDVRGVLKQAALAIRAHFPTERNPRLGNKHGEKLLYDPMVLVKGSGAKHDRWRTLDDGSRLLEISPGEFADARFENAGTWDQTPLFHAYGQGSGRFRYRFSATGKAPAEAIVRARISSEWPGTSAPPDGGSMVEVRLDDQLIGELAAIPDDGAGTVQEIVIRDRALLSRIGNGSHTLTFTVEDRPGAHGVCIYGAPTGNGHPPVGEAIPIEVRYRDTDQPASATRRARSSGAIDRKPRHSSASTGK